MRVIQGRSQKSLLALDYIKEAEGKDVLIVEQESLMMSKMVQQNKVYCLPIPSNSKEDVEKVIDVLNIGMAGAILNRDTLVVFYLNTDEDCLPLFQNFEAKHNISVIATLQTDGEVGEYTV